MDSLAPLMNHDVTDLVLLILIQDHSDHGFTNSFDAPWSEWSCITYLDPDHRKETHPQILHAQMHLYYHPSQAFLYPKQSHNMHKNAANPNAYTRQND